MIPDTRADIGAVPDVFEMHADSDSTLCQYAAIARVMGGRMESLGDIDRLISRSGGADNES